MSSAEERARARGSWPSEKTTLAAQSEAMGPASAEDAWHAVRELTWQAYSLRGAIDPPLPRSAWPSRIYRPGDPRPPR